MERGPLDELYQETILEHARYPQNTGDLPRADAEAEGKNPTCGDEVRLQLAVEDGRVSAVRFRGRGCALSQASASMLTEAVEGQSVAALPALIEAVEGLIRGEITDDQALGDLGCLKGVARVPMRIRCALLSWKVLRQALAELRPS
jgi:nitrogen fixation NifU-like protein